MSKKREVPLDNVPRMLTPQPPDDNMMHLSMSDDVKWQIVLSEEQRTQRNCHDVRDELAVIHMRIQRAMEHAELDEKLSSKSEEAVNQSTGGEDFNAARMRAVMDYRNALIAGMDKYRSECSDRKSLLEEIEEWMITEQNAELPEQSNNDDVLKSYKGVQTCLTQVKAKIEKLHDVGMKLLKEIGAEPEEVVQKQTTDKKPGMKKKQKQEVQEVPTILDDTEILSNFQNFDKTCQEVRAVMDKACLQLRIAAHRNEMKVGLKQFTYLMKAMQKRNDDLKTKEEILMELHIGEEKLKNKIHQSEQIIHNIKDKMKKTKQDQFDFKQELDQCKDLNATQKEQLDKAQREVERLRESNEELISRTPEIIERQVVKEVPGKQEPKSQAPSISNTIKLYQDKYKAVANQLEELKQQLKEAQADLVNVANERDSSLETIEVLREQVDAMMKGEKGEKIEPCNCREEVDTASFPDEGLGDLRNQLHEVSLEDLVTKLGVEQFVIGKPAVENVINYILDEYKNEINQLNENQGVSQEVVTKIEEDHKAIFENIQSKWVHLFKFMNNHKENLTEMFENHNLVDAARELQQVATILAEAPEEAADISEQVTQMKANVEQYFTTVVTKITSGLEKKQIKEDEIKVAQESFVNDLQTKLEKSEKAVQQKAALMKKFKEATEQIGYLEMQLRNNQREHEVQQKMLTEKYQTLVTQHKNIQKEMIAVKGSYQESIKNMEDMLQTANYHRRMLSTMIKEQEETLGTVAERAQKRTRQKEKVLKLNLHDNNQNLAALERALEEKKISASIYQMTAQMMMKRQELLEVKLGNLMRRYVAVCRLKQAQQELKLESETHSHLIGADWRTAIMMILKECEAIAEKATKFPSKKAKDLEKTQQKLMTDAFKKLDEYASEKAILIEMGITEDTSPFDQQNVNQQPGSCGHSPRRFAMPPKDTRSLPLPRALMGIGVHNPADEVEPLWKPAQAPHAEKVHFTAPNILQMDVHEKVRKAKHTLEKRKTYEMAIAAGYDYREAIPYAVKQTPSRNLQLPPINEGRNLHVDDL